MACLSPIFRAAVVPMGGSMPNASLREVFVSNNVPTETSVLGLMRRHRVSTVRALVSVMTPRWDVVRGLFTDEDYWHMKYGTDEVSPLPNPMDLRNYDDVCRYASAILDRVSTPDEAWRMPPYPATRWALDHVLLFRRWIAGGMPR